VLLCTVSKVCESLLFVQSRKFFMHVYLAASLRGSTVGISLNWGVRE